VAYSTGSSSVVLIGDTESKPETEPNVIQELQNKSVISVVIGDYHNAALTANGKLLTWGAYSNGALGLGDPTKLEPGTPGGFADERSKTLTQERGRSGELPEVNIPTEVRFDHNSKTPRDRFCFSATAAGWHTGALVIDLEVRSVLRLFAITKSVLTFQIYSLEMMTMRSRCKRRTQHRR